MLVFWIVPYQTVNTFTSEASANEMALPDEIIGVNSLNFEKTLPRLRDLIICREASVHDRKGGNDNGFTNISEYIRPEIWPRVVVIDVSGPGCIYSSWYSWSNHNLIPFCFERMAADALGNVNFYFEGNTRPELSIALDKWNGDPPFDYPLTVTGKESTGGYTSYLPIPFSDGLKGTVDGGGLPSFFYHYWFHSYPLGTEVQPLEAAMAQENAAFFDPETAMEPSGDIATELDDVTVSPSSTKDIFVKNESGTITCIRINIPEDDDILKSTWIQAYWDDESQPSINAPLSLFYAVENRFSKKRRVVSKNARLKSTVIGQDHEGMFYFRLPMPFKKNARISLCNKGAASAFFGKIVIEADTSVITGLGTSSGYFRTMFHESDELEPGRDYLFADIKGRGHIVGTILSVSDTSETFLEGDEHIYTDDCRTPFIIGDATETYFNGSWYFCSRAFSCPLHGAPTYRKKSISLGDTSDITMYRFHLTDLVPFRKRARFSIQHGPFNNVPGHYRSMVLYYGVNDSSLFKTDYIDMTDRDNLQNHDFYGDDPVSTKDLSGFFEGENNGQDLGVILKRPKFFPEIFWVSYLTITGIFHSPPEDSEYREHFSVVEHDAPYAFTVKIDPDNKGILLRRLFNQSIPDQRARVEVDGELAAVLYNAGSNQWKIWSEDDIVLKPETTANKDEIRIRIIPESPVFSSIEYTVFSIKLP